MRWDAGSLAVHVLFSDFFAGHTCQSIWVVPAWQVSCTVQYSIFYLCSPLEAWEQEALVSTIYGAGLSQKTHDRHMTYDIQFIQAYAGFWFVFSKKCLMCFLPKGQGIGRPIGIQHKSQIEETSLTSVWVFDPKCPSRLVFPPTILQTFCKQALDMSAWNTERFMRTICSVSHFYFDRDLNICTYNYPESIVTIVISSFQDWQHMRRSPEPPTKVWTLCWWLFEWGFTFGDLQGCFVVSSLWKKSIRASHRCSQLLELGIFCILVCCSNQTWRWLNHCLGRSIQVDVILQ